MSVNIPVFTLSSAFFPVNRCCEMSSYLMITRVFYSSLFFRASFYLISFFDKIFHFSIIDGNKTEIDLALMQAFLFSSVNYVVRIFNGKNGAKEKQRCDFWLDELPSYTWFGRISFSLCENIVRSSNWLELIWVLTRNSPGHWVILIFSGQKSCTRKIKSIWHFFLHFSRPKDVIDRL